jgi:class 3 adenylate cyclase
MGLHTGEPLLAGEGYVGVDVHKAARICSAGHGGQILVSERTKLAVADSDLRSLGAHRLKDLTAPSRSTSSAGDRVPAAEVASTSRTSVAADARSWVARRSSVRC